jgi:uncharacterized protein YndB with AHSA1/START domain
MNGVVRVARSYRADARRVYDAWLDPAVAGRWLFATATRPMTDVSIDARVDGAFRLARRDGGGVAYSGKYLALVPARRIAFSLSPCEGMGSTLVTVEIVPQRTGCRLALSHERVPAARVRELKARWIGILYGLGATLESLRFSSAALPATAERTIQGGAQCITC